MRNRAQPEGCIAEGYLAEECLTFCSRYLNNVETKINRPLRSNDESVIGGAQPFVLSEVERRQTHQYILFNCEKVTPYLEYVHLPIYFLTLLHSNLSF